MRPTFNNPSLQYGNPDDGQPACRVKSKASEIGPPRPRGPSPKKQKMRPAFNDPSLQYGNEDDGQPACRVNSKASEISPPRPRGPSPENKKCVSHSRILPYSMETQMMASRLAELVRKRPKSALYVMFLRDGSFLWVNVCRSTIRRFCCSACLLRFPHTIKFTISCCCRFMAGGNRSRCHSMLLLFSFRSAAFLSA